MKVIKIGVVMTTYFVSFTDTNTTTIAIFETAASRRNLQCVENFRDNSSSKIHDLTCNICLKWRTRSRECEYFLTLRRHIISYQI
jgi:hypothetical protein